MFTQRDISLHCDAISRTVAEKGQLTRLAAARADIGRSTRAARPGRFKAVQPLHSLNWRNVLYLRAGHDVRIIVSARKTVILGCGAYHLVYKALDRTVIIIYFATLQQLQTVVPIHLV